MSFMINLKGFCEATFRKRKVKSFSGAGVVQILTSCTNRLFCYHLKMYTFVENNIEFISESNHSKCGPGFGDLSSNGFMINLYFDPKISRLDLS